MSSSKSQRMSLVSQFGWVINFLIVIAFGNAGHCQGQQPIVLFDGFSANGWAKANGDQHPGWVVKDGALHRQAGGGDLYHEATFRDFELHFQWKISKAGNSGLKYRVQKYGNAMLGCEYQILDDQNAKEANKTAALYAVQEPSENKPIVGPDVWHYSKIVVCGDRIEHWLNGVRVVNADTGSDDWMARVAKSKFRDRKDFGRNRDGRIFLQDHGNPVWFRHIVLVPLNCDPGLEPQTVQHLAPPNSFETTLNPLPPLVSGSCDCLTSVPVLADSNCRGTGYVYQSPCQSSCRRIFVPVRDLRNRPALFRRRQ